MKKRVLAVIAAVAIAAVSFTAGTKANTADSLNMNTVIGYEATDTGLMLYTDDGAGYYIEK